MAVVGAIIGGIGLATSVVAQNDAKKASRNAAAENRKAQSEQRASNASQAAEERRKQVREERIRRARILQSSENTGTTGSSGEIGAIGGLATGLSAGIGSNLGAVQRADNISIFSQNAANYNLQAQEAQGNAQIASQIGGLGMSIFSSFGGPGMVKDAMSPRVTPAPIETRKI
jgi:hypothetical protein